jgi:predicted amidohydrolase
VKAAAVQLEVAIGDVERNLVECERLSRAAARAGAQLIALPEFFTTGVAFEPALADAALAPDGAAAQTLASVGRDEHVYVGGSFLSRDDDGEVRNAYLLAGPDGTLLGRHDKDMPTMWENAFYVGGTDDGVIDAGDFTAGAAVCWEFMRSATARRLRGRVDVVVGGSNWWSIPAWPPRVLTSRMEARNTALARRAPLVFGRYVGAPVVHGAMCGALQCRFPDLPAVRYHGRLEGHALVADRDGNVLAERGPTDGSGFVIADIELGRSTPAEPVPDRFWLHRRGWLSAYVWNSQRVHGRRWYRRHVRGRPPRALPARERAGAGAG